MRLALCKLFRKHPNVLFLDEPTNHMDIISKETLEDMLSQYTGTLIFVSHDRYFVKKLAEKLISFEGGNAVWYDCGYDEYLLKHQVQKIEVVPQQKAEPQKAQKKTYTTPLKEKQKRERAIQKAEEKIALLEEQIEGLKTELSLPENLADYLKLQELSEELELLEEKLLNAMAEWEELNE